MELKSICVEHTYHENRIYDIILVNRLAKFKNTDLFIESISKLLNKDVDLKILLVLPTEINESRQTHHNIDDLIEKFICSDRRRNITILRSDPNYAFLGFPREFVADLIAHSKVLCLFSKGEGVAKVIKEAQSLGTKVVAYSGLSGGGLDFDNDLIFKFDDYENAHQAILRALSSEIDKEKNFHQIINAVQSSTNEIYNLDNFKRDIGTLYSKKFQTQFSGVFDLVDLSRRLPNHYWDRNKTPWINEAIGKTNATDILLISSFRKFLKYV